MAQIEMEAFNLASPTFNEDETQVAEREEFAAQRAQDFLDRATGNIVGLTDHLDEWLERLDVTEKTKDMRRSNIKRFAKAFPTVPDVTYEGVQRFADLDIGKPKSTRNGSRKAFTTADVRRLVIAAKDDDKLRHSGGASLEVKVEALGKVSYR